MRTIRLLTLDRRRRAARQALDDLLGGYMSPAELERLKIGASAALALLEEAPRFQEATRRKLITKH